MSRVKKVTGAKKQPSTVSVDAPTPTISGVHRTLEFENERPVFTEVEWREFRAAIRKNEERQQKGLPYFLQKYA